MQQIPAPRQHLVRYYGAYSNRKRRQVRQAGESTVGIPPTEPTQEEGYRRPGPRWARLLHRSASRSRPSCRYRRPDPHPHRASVPPHPRTGRTDLVLDALEWIYHSVQQIPGPASGRAAIGQSLRGPASAAARDAPRVTPG